MNLPTTSRYGTPFPGGSSGKRRSLVFEFVGLPGSGKTTLAAKVAQTLSAQGLTVSEVYKDWNSGVFYRFKDNAASLTRIAVNHPSYTLSSAKTFVNLEALRLKQAGTLSINWLNRVSHILQAQRSNGVHLFDQGVYQMLWSVGFASGQPALEQLLSQTTLPKIDGVFLLEADRDVVKRRLEGRSGRTSGLERDSRSRAFEDAMNTFEIVKAVVGQNTASQLIGNRLLLDNNRDDVLETNAVAAVQVILEAWRGSNVFNEAKSDIATR